MVVAHKQHLDKKRMVKPKFVPAAITTHGEFGQGVFYVQEMFTQAYKRKLMREGPREDGHTIASLTATTALAFAPAA